MSRAAEVWDIVLAVMTGMGGVLAAMLCLYLIVGLARAIGQLARGDFDKNRGTSIYRTRKDKNK